MSSHLVFGVLEINTRLWVTHLPWSPVLSILKFNKNHIGFTSPNDTSYQVAHFHLKSDLSTSRVIFTSLSFKHLWDINVKNEPLNELSLLPWCVA